MPSNLGKVRVLLLADTHLGFDLPRRPRVVRPRRGPDFFASFERALQPAREGRVDLVVHGGDLLFRSRVPEGLVEQAFAPLKRAADAGAEVFVVPGNHERSSIPHPLWALHPRIHLFGRPMTHLARAGGLTVALAGFPYHREGVRRAFPGLLAQTGWRAPPADLRLLCMHHCFEGARVGPPGHAHVFTTADDVVRAADLPRGLNAVLSGHIHRGQVLTRDLAGRPLPAPVLYPGSTERTSLAEQHETKGYLLVELTAGSGAAETAEAATVQPERGGVRWRFVPLPTRPLAEPT